MQVFVIYAPENTAFVQRLAGDLRPHQVECILAAKDSQDEIDVFKNAPVVLVALSMAATKDARVLALLSTAVQRQKRIIALRIGPIEELPKTLKGVLPLDFSNEELQEENILTLLEDLTPPAPPSPLLPSNIQSALDHENALQRKHGIEQLGAIRHQLDADVRDLALQTLRDLAFKDPEATIKALAHNTLQLFSTDTADETTEEVIPIEPPRLSREDEDTPVIEPAPKAPTTPTLIPVWSTTPWRLSAIMGVLLALLHAYIGQNIASGLPIGLVWIVLPWLNIAIRDNGRLEWKMPGPLVGNIAVALVLGLVGIGLGFLVGGLEFLDIIALLAFNILYGGLIGWISTLYSAE